MTPSNDSKPTLFVGSSSEGIEVAQAVQLQLSDVADVELWNEGVLGLSYGTLESLVKALNSYDFCSTCLHSRRLDGQPGKELQLRA